MCGPDVSAKMLESIHIERAICQLAYCNKLREVMRHAGRHVALMLSDKAQVLESTQTKLHEVGRRDAVVGVVKVPGSTNAIQTVCLIA